MSYFDFNQRYMQFIRNTRSSKTFTGLIVKMSLVIVFILGAVLYAIGMFSSYTAFKPDK